MDINSYNSKVVVSGSVVEIYEYENSVLEGYKDTKKESGGRSVEADADGKKKNREQVLRRAKQDLRRLINSNIHQDGMLSKFVTLTFRENIIDLQSANIEFKNFVKRLNYTLGFKLKYAVVPEFQKRGAVHYHVVMFNVPYIANKKLQDIWGQGFVRINKIDEVDNVGAYVTKYMTEDASDERLIGQKCYFTSRNLYKPVVIKEKEMVENFAHSLPADKIVYENTFVTEQRGSICYKQYNLKREEIKAEVIQV